MNLVSNIVKLGKLPYGKIVLVLIGLGLSIGLPTEVFNYLERNDSRIDSLEYVITGLRDQIEVLVEEKEALENNFSGKAMVSFARKTYDVCYELERSTEAIRVHTVVLHDHEKSIKGDIPEITIFTEVVSPETFAIKGSWDKRRPPDSWWAWFDQITPEDRPANPYLHFHQVRDVREDRYLSSPESLVEFNDIGVKSLITFFIAEDKTGRLFYLTVTFDKYNPERDNPTLIHDVRRSAQALIRVADGI